MNRRSHLLIAVAVFCLLGGFRPGFALAEGPPDLPRVVTHDNLQSAGRLQDGVFTLRLDLREAAWHPDADDDPSLPVYAFGEEGGSPMIPAPLIRVAEGTKIHVYVHNRIAFPAVVHGLVTHPGDDRKGGLKIPAGETRDVTFSAGAAGTYYYWATTGDRDPAIDERELWDTQLDGAFIVDPPGKRSDDRIMVIGLWYHFLIPFDFGHGFHEVPTINGKSWPHTTRLTYQVGETIHWRVLNPTVSSHPMHLHGAYYTVDSVGDGERDNLYAPDQRRLVVTESMKPGSTMTLNWAPEHEGDWVFHCHIAAHFDGSLAQSVAAVMGGGGHQNGHEHPSMAGLVVAVHVLPSKQARTPAAGPVRHVAMTLEPRPSSASGRACISIAVEEGGQHYVTHAGTELGPTLVLYRGQPSEITVVNHLNKPTAIHWHGMELESYYDGVPGVSGDARGVTPSISPDSSFVVRMTPPRAGTFIYHTHWHDMDQLTSGLYGPLIVLEPGQKYDPATDKVFFISERGDDASLLNGASAPATEQWRVGTKYRIRLINITPNSDGMVLSLLDGDKPVEWLPVAKDGADLPTAQRIARQAKQRVGVGETYDFEYQPAQPGKLTVDLFRPFDKADVRLPVIISGEETTAAKR